MPYNRLAKNRVKGVQVHRPFIYGSLATPITAANRSPDINPDHTHKWTIYIRPLPHSDLTHWLKRVQFKLHETYANSTRTIESPGPFEVTETGWGEFEVQIKLWFVPEANEKAQTLWHALKLHPYGPDAEGQRERGRVESICYEEVVFSEPVEGFFEVLSGGGKGGKGKVVGSRRTADIPQRKGEGVFSVEMEVEEVARMREAVKRVEEKVREERAMLVAREQKMEWLKKEKEENV